MTKGWIKLDRQIMDNWIYRDKPFNKSMAWIDMLLLADHTTHEAVWRGNKVTFKRGDVNLSISELAYRWGWSRDKTRRYLRNLEQDNMIRINATVNRTSITLVNYGFFQGWPTTDKTTDKTTEPTSNKTTEPTYLKNNKNNIKNKKNTVQVAEATDCKEDDWTDADYDLAWEKLVNGEE